MKKIINAIKICRYIQNTRLMLISSGVFFFCAVILFISKGKIAPVFVYMGLFFMISPLSSFWVSTLSQISPNRKICETVLLPIYFSVCGTIAVALNAIIGVKTLGDYRMIIFEGVYFGLCSIFVHIISKKTISSTVILLIITLISVNLPDNIVNSQEIITHSVWSAIAIGAGVNLIMCVAAYYIGLAFYKTPFSKIIVSSANSSGII